VYEGPPALRRSGVNELGVARMIATLADRVGSATLVAVTVTICGVVTVDGAV
jgi:hypothetical protein